MAMSRCAGGTSLTTRSPMRIVPLVGYSSPASMRNVVVLPQPEGPSRLTNSPVGDREVELLDRDRAAEGLAHLFEADAGHAASALHAAGAEAAGQVPCRKAKMTISGRLIITEAAISSDHSMLKEVISMFMTPVVSGRAASGSPAPAR